MSQSPDKILKITLTPLGRFFFGGEIVFGGKGAQDDRRRSYLVHSNIFPQQTSILGMLREQLLRQNDLLFPWDSSSEKEQAKKLIGNTGFGLTLDPKDSTALKSADSFGFIKELSPLLLEDSDGNLMQPMPLDEGTGKEGLYLSWSQEAATINLENFDAKAGLSLHFATEKKSLVSVSDCFAQQNQVGITVTNRKGWRVDRADNKEAFFRQTFYKNNDSKLLAEKQNNYSFTFWVRIKSGLAEEFEGLSNATVTLGGERSTFTMKVEKADNKEKLSDFLFPVTYQYNTEAPKGYTRLLLLSDTYLPTQILEKHNVFPVAEPVTFRFFSTTLDDTTDFYLLAKEEKEEGSFSRNWKKSGRRQSKLFTLLRRGGVLLVPEDKRSEVEEAIEKQTAFHQIGYNYIQKI